MRGWALVAFAWMTVACGASVRPGDGSMSTPDATVPDGGCVAPGGRVLREGESFSDGCNACFCSGGTLSCTGRICDDVVQPQPVCSAPDGTPVPVGGEWSSPDGCTQCVCQMGAALTCASRSDCFDGGPAPQACFAPDMTRVPVGSRVLTRDFCLACTCDAPGGGPAVCFPSGDSRCPSTPPPLCTDPGGRPIPVGSCFTEPCRQCCCTNAGVMCRPSSDPRCADAGPPSCNTVAQSPVLVMPRAVAGRPPTATGGVINDGYYVLTELLTFGGATPMLPSLRYAVQVRGATMQFAVQSGTMSLRANFSVAVGGALIRLTPTCSEGGTTGMGSGQFTARATDFDLFIDSGGGGQVQQMRFARR